MIVVMARYQLMMGNKKLPTTDPATACLLQLVLSCPPAQTGLLGSSVAACCSCAGQPFYDEICICKRAVGNNPTLH